MHVWTPVALARGPIGLVSAATLPVRHFAGGLWLAAEDWRSGGAMLILVGPPALVAWTGLGVLLMPVAAGRALAETATGGYYELVDEDELYFLPSAPVPDAHRKAWQWGFEDRCGRPVSPEERVKGSTPTPGPIPPSQLRP